MDFNKLKSMMDSKEKLSYEELTEIPKSSGVYLGWREGFSQCFYVGKSKNLQKRIGSHYSGQRGGDQFCLYVYDQIIHDMREKGLKTQEVNAITSSWIRNNVKFQFITLPVDEINDAECLFRMNLKPALNPL